MKSKEEIRRKVSERYEDTPSIHHKFNIKFSKKYITNKKVLDVGCWTGNSLMLASKHTQNLYGIDTGKKAIAYAKSRLPYAKFKVGKAQSLKFRNSFFDTVFFLEVIEHIPQKDEMKALSEINRVLKMNGVLIISTPYKNTFSILGDPAYFLIGHRHYSEKRLKQLLFNAGFTIIKVKKTGGFFRIITVNLDLILKHVLNIKIHYPKFVNRKIEKEYVKEGFFEIHIIARKISEPEKKKPIQK